MDREEEHEARTSDRMLEDEGFVIKYSVSKMESVQQGSEDVSRQLVIILFKGKKKKVKITISFISCI